MRAGCKDRGGSGPAILTPFSGSSDKGKWPGEFAVRVERLTNGRHMIL